MQNKMALLVSNIEVLLKLSDGALFQSLPTSSIAESQAINTYIHNLYLTWLETVSLSYFAGFPH